MRLLRGEGLRGNTAYQEVGVCGTVLRLPRGERL